MGDFDKNMPRITPPQYLTGDSKDEHSEKLLGKDPQYYTNLYVGNPNGWTCPKCGRVYGPMVPECVYCNNQLNKIE